MKIKFKHWWHWFLYRKERKTLQKLADEMEPQFNKAMERAFFDQIMWGKSQVKVFEDNGQIKIEHVPFVHLESERETEQHPESEGE